MESRNVAAELAEAEASAARVDDDDQPRREHDGKLLSMLDDIFDHAVPDSAGVAAITDVREGAKAFAEIIYRTAPRSADRTLAIQHVRDAMMRTNASIVLKGKGVSNDWEPLASPDPVTETRY